VLVELAIANFAIIDRLQLRLGEGFNALTGETGAGKSIIIDAMSAMLGAKIGPEFVRHGATTARVEGQFDLTRLDPEATAALRDALQEAGLLDTPAEAGGDAPSSPAEDDLDTLILAREIHQSGRTVARVNGSLVNLATLREIGELLVDIHGQTEHQSLLRVPTHLELLDQYAGLAALRAEVADLVTRLRAVRNDLTRLQRDERELARRADLLKFQVEEIDKAALVEGEDTELNQERVRLMNAERLGSLADSIYALLIAGPDEEAAYSGRGTRRGEAREVAAPAKPVRDGLGEAARHLADLNRLDPTLAAYEQTLDELRENIEELGRQVRLYRETVEADPERLMEVEERLTLIHNLKRKYGQTLAEIIAYGQQAAAELDTLTHSEERIAELQEEEAALVAEAAGSAVALSARRKEAGERLARAVEQSMADLMMGSIKFATSITHAPDPRGLPIPTEDGGEQTVAFDTRGVDRVEFLISPNPGEPLKPLSKIASGGETSRLMLALKSILSAADHTPTLIFDEIDVGVGGRSGQVVGEKLWSLTDNHQVICITHLPQIAAFADTHFKITKQVRDDRTSTRVDALAEKDRVQEVAAMLGGVLTPAQLENARDSLRHTAHLKALRHGATASDLLTGNGHRSTRPDPAWPVIAGRPGAGLVVRLQTGGHCGTRVCSVKDLE
jgi:DNA repair protein RecN (Recombination protein N)